MHRSAAPQRLTAVGTQTLELIESTQLCVNASAAGRLVARMRKQGDARKLTQRYPLYGCVACSSRRLFA